MFLIVITVLVGGAYVTYKYLYKDHRDISTEDTHSQWTAHRLWQLLKEQPSNEVLNKTLEIKGKVTKIEEEAFIMDEVIYVDFETGMPDVSVNDKVTVKGRCLGYDDLFELVNIDQSTLIQTE